MDYPVLPTTDELKDKHRRVTEYLEKHSLDGLLLFSTTNIAWYTGGSEVHVSIIMPNGSCALLVTPEQVLILADAVETPRMEQEAFQHYSSVAPVPVKLQTRPWYEALWAQVGHLAKGKTLATDDPSAPGLVNHSAAGSVNYRLCGREFLQLRYSLTSREIERFRVIGKQSAIALEHVAAEVHKGNTEYQIASLLTQKLVGLGLTPALTLVAADERAGAFRHPVPTFKTMDKYCMLVICARGGGLVCSATRLVHFGPLSPELRKKHDAVVRVDGELLAGSSVGARMSDLFQIAKQAYATQGFAGEEARHHQGGATGYLSREYKAAPGSGEVLYPNQAVAWNPSITGTKSEDTYLVAAEKGKGSGMESLECLTHGDGNWPMLKVEVEGKTLFRPDILVL